MHEWFKSFSVDCNWVELEWKRFGTNEANKFSLGPAPRPGRVMVLMCLCVCVCACLLACPPQ